jgi:hypothetical protein
MVINIICFWGIAKLGKAFAFGAKIIGSNPITPIILFFSYRKFLNLSHRREK